MDVVSLSLTSSLKMQLIAKYFSTANVIWLSYWYISYWYANNVIICKKLGIATGLQKYDELGSLADVTKLGLSDQLNEESRPSQSSGAIDICEFMFLINSQIAHILFNNSSLIICIVQSARLKDFKNCIVDIWS